MQCEFPSKNIDDEKIKTIFEKTKTIAIVGLSPNKEKDSNRVATYLQNVGFKIVPIYPKEDEILGEKVYRSLREVPFEIHMVDIFRKPNVIPTIVEESIKRKDINYIWTQLGIVNNEASEIAENNGLVVVQNKCTKIEHMKLF